MEENKKYLIRQISKQYNIDYYVKWIKFIPIGLFTILNPVLIYDEFVEGNLIRVIFFLIAEVFFLFLFYFSYLSIKEKTSFTKSRINKCFDNPHILNRIIIYNNKILFDISEMEDEAFYLNNSDLKDKVVSDLKIVFGNSKIIYNS